MPGLAGCSEILWGRMGKSVDLFIQFFLVVAHPEGLAATNNVKYPSQDRTGRSVLMNIREVALY